MNLLKRQQWWQHGGNGGIGGVAEHTQCDETKSLREKKIND